MTQEDPDCPHQNEQGDWVCRHGTAMYVHCCNCHNGFLFDAGSCICRLAALEEGYPHPAAWAFQEDLPSAADVLGILKREPEDPDRLASIPRHDIDNWGAVYGPTDEGTICLWSDVESVVNCLTQERDTARDLLSKAIARRELQFLEQDAEITALREANATLKAALEVLIIDANRLCDRQLGGSYEDDCRKSIAAARLVLK